MPASQPGPSRRKAAASTLVGSSAATLVAALQAIVLMPLYLRELGPVLYGAWMASGEALMWTLALDFGIPNVLIQRIGAAWAKKDTRTAGAYFATGAIVVSVLAMFVAAVLLIASPFVPGWVGLVGPDARLLTQCFAVASAAMALMLLNYLMQALSRSLQITAAVNVSGFLGVVLGFAATSALLLNGYGLWSIAAGLVIRGSVALAGSFLFFFLRLPSDFRKEMRFSRPVFSELVKLAPPTFISGGCYTLMQNTQVFLAAVLLGPATATVFGITRKGAELCRAVLDTVGYASYGGFAHLAASEDKDRGKRVYRELVSTYLTAAVALLSAYAAVNPSLISLWVGPEMYGGTALTLLTAAAILTSGWSYLLISLYRSLGHHVACSVALLVACVGQLALVIILARWLGTIGFPLGMVIAAACSGLWARTMLHRELSSTDTRAPSTTLLVWACRGALCLAAVVVCSAGAVRSWLFVLALGVALSVGTVLFLARVDPALRRALSFLSGQSKEVQA